MRYHPGAGFEAMRDRAPVEGQVNLWPLAILISVWLWLGIWLVARVVAR